MCDKDPDAVTHLQDEYLKSEQAGYGEFYVLPSLNRPGGIDGYYRISGSSFYRKEASNKAQKMMRLHGPASVYVLVYIARDDRALKGTGKILITDAARRGRYIYPNNWGLTLFAKNRGLVKYYLNYGFVLSKSALACITEEDAASGRGEAISSEPYLMYAPYHWLTP